MSRQEFLKERWPLLVIAFGVFLVLRSFGGQPGRAADDAHYISSLGVLSTQRRKLTSQTFQGGDLVAFMGGCEIDLTQAELAAEGAVIDLFAFWGGITIKVPPQWIVELQTISVMGGSEEKAQRDSALTGPRLVVNGLVIMGGVEISS